MGRKFVSLIITFLISATLAGPPLSAKSKNKKTDPDEIGNRDVGKGVNFYSLEKEIALGKQMARKLSGRQRL